MDAKAASHLDAMGLELDAVPGIVSVYCGRLGASPAYQRLADETHYAASTMKTAIMVAAFRPDNGLDLDSGVEVHDEFESAAPGAGRFAVEQDYDNDDEVWARLGKKVPLRWLVRRMIVRSSNLATNLVLERVGIAAAAQVWRNVGATRSVLGRGIQDYAARDAGISNLVTAADLARLLSWIATGAQATTGTHATTGAQAPTGPRDACREMIDILLAQECNDDLPEGLPAGTRIAHKNGWVDGIRHGSGVIFPGDAPPYLLTVCTTSDLADADAAGLVARLAAASWADRHEL